MRDQCALVCDTLDKEVWSHFCLKKKLNSLVYYLVLSKENDCLSRWEEPEGWYYVMVVRLTCKPVEDSKLVVWWFKQDSWVRRKV